MAFPSSDALLSKGGGDRCRSKRWNSDADSSSVTNAPSTPHTLHMLLTAIGVARTISASSRSAAECICIQVKDVLLPASLPSDVFSSLNPASCASNGAVGEANSPSRHRIPSVVAGEGTMAVSAVCCESTSACANSASSRSFACYVALDNAIAAANFPYSPSSS